MFYKAMQEQLESMDQEEDANNFINSNKTYPYGLFNLVSSPLFYNMSLDRKCNAISHSLSGEILKDILYYDSHNEFVYFCNKRNLLHTCNLRLMQVLTVKPLPFHIRKLNVKPFKEKPRKGKYTYQA
jgi:hypothetical protein